MTDELSDQQLWERMNSGDEFALGILFERHVQRIFRFVVRFQGTYNDADDVVTETFLEAWRVRQAIAVKDSAIPILLAIARRRTQDHLRGHRRRALLLSRVAANRTEQFDPDPADMLARRNERNDQREWLRRQVSGLPPEQRDVVELCVFAEMNYEDCAKILGLPVGTVKSRLSRARQRLVGAPPVEATATAAKRDGIHVG